MKIKFSIDESKGENGWLLPLIGLVLILTITVVLFTAPLRADRYSLNKSRSQLEDFFFNQRYAINQGTVTSSGAALKRNLTFYGYADEISFKSNAGQTTWTLHESSFTEGALQQGVLFSGDTFDAEFTVPVNSPTIITVGLEAGATLQYYIGGYKNK